MGTTVGAGGSEAVSAAVRRFVVAAADGVATALWRRPTRAVTPVPARLAAWLLGVYACWTAVLVALAAVRPLYRAVDGWATFAGAAVLSIIGMAVALRWPLAGWRVVTFPLVVNIVVTLDAVRHATAFLLAPSVCIVLAVVGLQHAVRTAAATGAVSVAAMVAVAVANRDANILAAIPLAVITVIGAATLRARADLVTGVHGALSVRAMAEAAADGLARALWRRESRTPWPPGIGGALLGVAAAGWTVLLAASLLTIFFAPVQAVPPAPVGLLLLAVAVVAMAVAVRRPVWAWRVVALGPLVALLNTGFPSGLALTYLHTTTVVVIGLIGLRHPVRTAVAAGGVSSLALYVIDGLSPNAGLGAPIPFIMAMVVVTGLVRSRRLARIALEAERERSAAARAERAVLAERARIAREMHDVVAHHMSLIAVRCESAPYRLAGLDGAAGAEFSEVATAAREALVEMQTLLGVLRGPDQAVEHSPQPGLADVAGLLDAAVAAGTAVTWSVTVEKLPEPLGRTVYRVVQQALSNAAQHARGAPVEVVIAESGDAVRVVVVNGAGAGSEQLAGSGQGLIGMRERVELHGGRLDAGPEPDGGFAVRAELPT